MVGFSVLVKRVIEDSDIVLLVLDSRDLEATYNEELVELVGRRRKKLLYVLNKIDLVPSPVWGEAKKRYRPWAAVSCTKHLGTMMLLRKINELAKGEPVTVGVVGYPNTGKSSVINAMKSRGSASTSPVAGHTKAVQKIRVSDTVVLLDTPGVLQKDQTLEQAQALELVGTKDVDRIKDPEIAASRLIDQLGSTVAAYYGVEHNKDYEELLEAIAIKKHVVKTGNKPDTFRMAKQILRDYQAGKII